MSAAAEILALLAKHEPPATAVTKIGLTPAQVRALAAQCRPVELPTPQEARRGLARLVRDGRRDRSGRRGAWGRRGLPEHVWRAMYAEYCAGRSCAEVAAIFGGTRQSVHEVFRVRGLRLRPRHLRLHAKIEYRGRAYTPGKNGYYRATAGDRRPLHRALWEDAHGPIPAGWQVTFKNADHGDLRLDNLECLPIADVTRYHGARHRGARAEAA
ncbi:MAG: HNH endonuclease [Verrucomicrobia bacterium]|nr:HNH endonuclease [Verrucomicrobiota bacterium]